MGVWGVRENGRDTKAHLYGVCVWGVVGGIRELKGEEGGVTGARKWDVDKSCVAIYHLGGNRKNNTCNK